MATLDEALGELASAFGIQDDSIEVKKLEDFLDNVIITLETSDHPKGDGGWKGEKGDRGPVGLQGPIGEKGETGERGPPGDTGPKGEQGETGLQGLPGDKGDTGEQGLPGLPGEKGDKGDPGEKGEKGDQGLPGHTPEFTFRGQWLASEEYRKYDVVYCFDGEHSNSYVYLNETPGILVRPALNTDTSVWMVYSFQGLDGRPGQKGEKGDMGPAGPPPNLRVRGLWSASVADYRQNDLVIYADSKGANSAYLYVNESPGLVSRPDIVNDIWTAFAIHGPKGDPGPQGTVGPQGEPGPPGAQGNKGEKGDKGDTGDAGPQGEQGIQGPKGDTGDIGPKGDKGDQGNTGSPGQKGDTGPKGEKGDKGDPGDAGNTGPMGPPAIAKAPGVVLDDWTADDTGGGAYRARYDNAAITANSMVMLSADIATQNVLKQVYTQSYNGYCHIYSMADAAVTVDIAIIF